MSDNVINLRAFRKAKSRAEAGKRAEENRAKFGRTKAEKRARKAEEARAEKTHAGGKLTPVDRNHEPD
jgi:hypothetical protein